MAVEGTRDRVHLSFDVAGASSNGGKAPIILLHGITSSKATWQNVIHPIADATRRKVYAFDARNHGDSGWSDQFDYDIMKDDLLQFMDCIHAEKAILIGHSMGGRIAMTFATAWPERVEKLIVEEMSPKKGSLHMRDHVVKYMQMLQDAVENIPPDVKDLQEAKNFVYEFMHKNDESQEDHDSRRSENVISWLPLCQDENGQFKWKTNLKVIGEYLLSVRRTTDVNGMFPGPTLMIYGTKSPFKVSADRDIIKRIFPAAQLRAVEDATHQVHHDKGDVFVKEVSDFINESQHDIPASLL